MLAPGAASGPQFTVEDDGFGPIYGAGVQLALGKIAVRAEYERLKFSSDAADLVSIGLMYRF